MTLPSVGATSLCLPSQTTVQQLFSVARDAGVVPDISLDPVLTAFLSMESRASLLHQYASLQRGMTPEQLASFRHNVSGELGGSTRVRHGGVGVVALALSVLFDLVAKKVGDDFRVRQGYCCRSFYWQRWMLLLNLLSTICFLRRLKGAVGEAHDI
jgi:hypothetical protein